MWHIYFKYILVATTWTLWNAWSTCNQICDTGTKYRDRQCPGSNPLGTINKPAKTPQYGGERDCSGDTREQPNCNTHSCSRKLKLMDVLFHFFNMLNNIWIHIIIYSNSISAIVVTTITASCSSMVSMYNSKTVEIKSPNYPKNYNNRVSKKTNYKNKSATSFDFNIENAMMFKFTHFYLYMYIIG